MMANMATVQVPLVSIHILSFASTGGSFPCVLVLKNALKGRAHSELCVHMKISACSQIGVHGFQEGKKGLCFSVIIYEKTERAA